MMWGDEDEKGKFRGVLSRAEDLENKFKLGGNKADSFADFGLCKDCGNLIGCVTKFDKRFVRCMEIPGIKFNPSDPVVYCTIYYRKGQLDIHTMKEMATMVEVKREVGFLNNDEEK